MAKTWFDGLEDTHLKFIAEQQMFFTATAAPEGRVNMAPKDSDSLKVMGANRIIWVNLTGAENETGAHWAESKRMTLMWCSFTNTPMILRAYGQADLIQPRDKAWDELITHFPPRIGSRQILDVNVDFVLKSCGFGVPLYDFVGQRDTLRRWEERKGVEGVRQHWEERNQMSIDSKPTGLLSDPA
jgi:Pyridoxamine 5'-phosphate oxidase